MRRSLAVGTIALLLLTACGSGSGDAFEDAIEAEAAAEEAVQSGLAAAVDACDLARAVGTQILDDGAGLEINGRPADGGLGLTWEQAECILDEIGVTEMAKSKMLSTRSLDGRLDAAWGDYAASWTYHPDDGLDMLVEFTPSD